MLDQNPTMFRCDEALWHAACDEATALPRRISSSLPKVVKLSWCKEAARITLACGCIENQLATTTKSGHVACSTQFIVQCIARSTVNGVEAVVISH